MKLKIFLILTLSQFYYFLAGGFLHIALTSILPELIKEDDAIESIKQLACIMLGVLVMGTVNCLTN